MNFYFWIWRKDTVHWSLKALRLFGLKGGILEQPRAWVFLAEWAPQIVQYLGQHPKDRLLGIQFPLLSPALGKHFRKCCFFTVTLQKEPTSKGGHHLSLAFLTCWIACCIHLLPTNRAGFVWVSSCQAPGLSLAQGGQSPLVPMNYILLSSHCFRNKHVIEVWPMR